jgi:hypothetical protein
MNKVNRYGLTTEEYLDLIKELGYEVKVVK